VAEEDRQLYIEQRAAQRRELEASDMFRSMLMSAMVMGMMMATAGCGSDACEDAAAKLEDECGEDVGEAKEGLECAGQDECEAQCFLDHGRCEDLDKTLMEADPAFRDCMLGCVGE
jgi:hypothetical protein